MLVNFKQTKKDKKQKKNKQTNKQTNNVQRFKPAANVTPCRLVNSDRRFEQVQCLLLQYQLVQATLISDFRHNAYDICALLVYCAC
jgi:hypothetical protein